ncbi:hypothetical protein J25TS5_30900 [Paenibacillus faecis]|uniref:hypothetical protein n=1 Tax=Paenibacillus faecis TaxID=862114 RepID=UPI001B0639F8|nr:hypothetical protein [Paenibacillus faecis]GIO86158.1 hypothetical protein J25TS5_30900 [Paenibacillus faecis]
MRKYFGLLVTILMVSIVVGIVTSKSFENNLAVQEYTKKSEIRLNLIEDENLVSTYFNNEIDSLNELIDQSDLILKVKATKNRLNYSQTIKTKVEVMKVYKGANLEGKHEIYIYEPSYFFGPNYLSFGGYNIMQDDGEYIVFLKHLKKPEGYKYKGDEDVSFVPTSTYYGKFEETSNEKTNQPLSREELDNGIKYSKVKDWAIITTKQEQLQKYNELRNAVMAEYK